MKKTIRNILLVTALSPLLVQCATQDEVARLQYQLHMMNKKLADMQNSTVGDIQKQQAASLNQIDTLEKEILLLKGQLEETNMQNQLLKEQNDALQSNIGNVAKEEAQRREEALTKIQEEQRSKEALIAELNDRLKAQQESLQAIQDARVREAERRAEEARAKADSARAKTLTATASSPTAGSGTVMRISNDQAKRVLPASGQSAAAATEPAATIQAPAPAAVAEKKPAPAPAETPPTAKAAEPETVQQPQPPAAAAPSTGTGLASADQLFQQKQFAKAYSEYEKVALADPTSDEGISAGYMMGECLYNQKEYDKAILQYQKIISQSGNHPKAAAATLKQAMAFEKLSDNETAKMIYKKIVNHYGSSPEAKIAKEKLGTL